MKYNESKRVKICEFRAKNNKKNLMIYLEIELYKNKVFYINFKGERSTEYGSIEEAKEDIISLYGHWADFKLLI